MADMAATRDLPQRARAMLESLEDGRTKLYVTWKCLSLRRDCSAHFQQGEYLPLATRGVNADCVCAQAWRHDDSLIIAAAPRYFASLMSEGGASPLGTAVWRDTAIELPAESHPADYVNIFTGERLAATSAHDPADQALILRAAELFANFPVALLRQELVKAEERPL
jgi:(1->4)-alpha-D-glucan 1-alpha-D-glucosylmutase